MIHLQKHVPKRKESVKGIYAHSNRKLIHVKTETVKNIKVILCIIGVILMAGVALFLMFNSKPKTDGTDTTSNKPEAESQIGAQESQGRQEAREGEAESGERKVA
jgi:flagellar basal body-associated protein FliL